MGKLFKMPGIMFVFYLLALPLLAGCDVAPWESGMVLSLKVDAPRDGTTVTTSTVMVSGRVIGSESASANVAINDQDVPVKDGKFSANVTLTEGANIITIVATTGAVTQTQSVAVTYIPAK